MDMEDANTYEIDSLIKTKEIKDQAPHSWGFFVCWMMGRFGYGYIINGKSNA